MLELQKLISLIQMKYNNINEKLQNSMNYFPINMKKKRVEDVYNDENLLLYIFDYRNFINEI